jgi:HD-like signal output (HDOD) protein
METEKAVRLIDKIDQVMAKKIHIEAISQDVFRTLDDFNADRQAIELIGIKLSEDIRLRLTAMANSVYFGSLRHGHADSFFDVVNCLGLERTKSLIIAMTFYCHGRHDHEIETVFARSFATSILAMILAAQVGFREDALRKAELSGLFMEIGRSVMVLYNKMYAGDEEALDNDFIDTYHPYLGDRIAKRYELPDYIRTIILSRNLILEENAISLAGIVQMAHSTVSESFQKYNNMLVIKCQVPRPATDVTRTLEAILKEKFAAIGLENYLYVIRIPRLYNL